MTYRQYWLTITSHFQFQLHELNFILAFALSCPWSISLCSTWLNYPDCWLFHLKQLLFFSSNFHNFLFTVQIVTYECSIFTSQVRVSQTIGGCLCLDPLWLSHYIFQLCDDKLKDNGICYLPYCYFKGLWILIFDF